jgi:predicted transposase YdaD
VTQKADIGSKRLISLAPDAWSQWVTESPDVAALEFLDTGFQWVSRHNDVLIKAFSPRCGDFLIPNEIQLRCSLKMPRRVRAYAALAEEKYQLPTYPVLINILPPADGTVIPERFESEVLGLHARQDFKVINLWQVDANIVFNQSLSSLLPLVPVLRGGGNPDLIQEAVLQLRQDDTLSELEPLLAFFASFVLDTELIRQILRWDMAVLRESPWYQEISQEAEARGEARGESRGEARGKIQEALSLALRLLARRIGSIPSSLAAQIQGLPLDTLESLSLDLLDFNAVEDLQHWLDANQ